VILADASIWIDFFRSGASKTEMENLILGNQLVMHPFLVAELALGSLRDRQKTLAYLDRLPRLTVVTLNEVRQMIEARSLYAKGIGLTDAHLIASCLASPGTQLWTRDQRLNRAATELAISASLP
jgi:predicted nucleic acid-binding protein